MCGPYGDNGERPSFNFAQRTLGYFMPDRTAPRK
jgi:hypothetical protein